MAVSETAVQCLTYIEQVFWEKGSIPSNERIADAVGCSKSTVEKHFRDDQFRGALRKRGIDLQNLESDSPILTFDQLNVVNLMLNTYDKRSMREKLEEVGVSTQQLNAWMRDPKFARYLNQRAAQKFQDADTQAYLSLIKGMEKGDLRATQLFLEMRGIYNPRLQVDVNVSGVLMRVVEIISKYVRDPATLASIAEEMEQLGGVQPMQTPALPEASDAGLDTDIVDAEVIDSAPLEL